MGGFCSRSNMKKTILFVILIFLAVIAYWVLKNRVPDGVTVITISDRVLQKEIEPFGVNISGDAYYGMPKLKIRFEENFEGTIYRQCHRGVLFEDGFVTEHVSRNTAEEQWGADQANYRYLYPGAEIRMLSGPARGEVRTITGFSSREIQNFRTKRPVDGLMFMFDKKVGLPDGPVEGAGVLINSDQSQEGCLNRERNPKKTYWVSTNVEMSNDVMPGSFGYSSLLLDGSRSQTVWNNASESVEENGINEAYYCGSTSWRRFYDTNGKWHIRLKAKLVDTNAVLLVRTKNVLSPEIRVPATQEWQEFELISEISGIDKPDGADDESFLVYQFLAQEGRVLIDDLVIYKESSDRNPTVFMDSFVNALQQLQPNILRYLMHGGDMLSTLSPRIDSMRASNDINSSAGPYCRREQQPWGMGEFYELCEYLEAEAWFCLPGTLFPDDIDLYMEYIGGPRGTRGGDLRIAHGHPEPWTESLRKIHIEIGNEAWNINGGYRAGGYNGPDYWENIFKAIKASPYYRSNIICHAAGQNYVTDMSDRILRDTPGADRYAIAPYQLNSIFKAEMDEYETDGDFFRYCLAYPTRSVPVSMTAQSAIAEKYGKELSINEINWHLTRGDVDATGVEPNEIRARVNRFFSSTAGGLGNLNHMLMLVKNFGIHSMCHYKFGGEYFSMKLWGMVIAADNESARLRPSGLLFTAANEVMTGDLLETKHSDNQPMFTAIGNFHGTPKSTERKRELKRPVSEVICPEIWSYAFKNGKEHSLILMNMNLEEEREIILKFTGGVAEGTVRSKIIAPEHYLDNNELESGDIGVRTENIPLEGFKNGTRITLPPSSCQTIRWMTL